ncbi:hypothetical protein ONA24_03440 [Mycoplasmopsis cynos]|uniref:hypothetical protein n=1 Tax=Mycoplasmopsis cynos TaxID=171284 RepID=UPI0021FAC054|nr:hypothetical protein [Mycoplasmopsis cynos]UWV82402.1 hypothetical protein NW067_05415 [Mycoplasmopsis cynos]WAM04023.1 hypothetical protein ONA22_03510 [Mycoplasmopsis cynos]WAM06168.1 hypothetical protein ONA23_03975 [Mycoplasmopsis cynos]WAM10290.1 hypothetical protein ONA24_03440 [Mycoplasmopsis cynos]WQQ18523.1 hypothetical protein RRG53_00400 [Mycoplasmopsis cynos]
MNNKIIVWDLFGGGQNSVYQAIGDNPLFEIYTFDLYPEKYHNKQYVIDLSQDISYLRSTKLMEWKVNICKILKHWTL